MKIFTLDPENPDNTILKKAGKIVRSGGTVIYPTETLYGIGGDPFNLSVREKIFEIKKRDRTKHFNYIISGTEVLEDVSKELPALFYMLIERFWPGPLTIIINRITLPGEDYVLESPGIRIPSNNIARKLTEHSGGILVSTSANISSEKDSETLHEIPNEIKEKVDIILDSGQIVKSLPSTIIDLTQEDPKIVREGAIKKNSIEEFIGPVL